MGGKLKRVKVTTPHTRDAMVGAETLGDFAVGSPPFPGNSGRVYEVEADVAAEHVKGFRKEFETRDYSPETEVTVTDVPEPA